ncbi:malate synthase A [soil metagenome]
MGEPTVDARVIDAPGPAASLDVTDELAAKVATDVVLDDVALALVGTMSRVHDHARRGLLEARAARAALLVAGEVPGLDPETEWIRDGDWSVGSAPADLADRRVEITGPVDRKMMVSALNSGAKVFMADFEDSLSPTWANVIDGQLNVRDAAHLSLTFERPDGSVDTLDDQIATLVVRPRGLHLSERHVIVDGAPVGAALFDVTLAALHSAEAFAARGSGLYLYLPKLESHHEAEWWDAVLADLERRLGLPVASIKVTVLVETILAALEMDEILYALRERIVGLNAGRWDYSFSISKRLGQTAAEPFPDRGSVTMTVPFMAAYAERLVATAHRRGAHAIGGMSAFIPNRRDADVTAAALSAVRRDKERESGLGYDGTWVAHPDLVPVAMSVFDGVLGDRPNQLEVVPTLAPTVEALLDTAVPGATITRAGLVDNISVGLQYIEAWLGGRGAVAINNLMEDAATAEISRSQVWQWVAQGAVTVEGDVISAELVESELAAEQKRLVDAGLDADRVAVAAELFRDAALGDVLPEFLTIAAELHLE